MALSPSAPPGALSLSNGHAQRVERAERTTNDLPTGFLLSPKFGYCACFRACRLADQKSAMSSTELIFTARRMVPNLSKSVPVVYFLRLRSGMLNVGASVDLEQRLDDRLTGVEVDGA